MHPSRSLSIYHYKAGISTEELAVALKRKIQEARSLDLDLDINTDFVINPRTEKDVVHEHDGLETDCITNTGNFAIDAAVMHLMTRGKDENGAQRVRPNPDYDEKIKDSPKYVEVMDFILKPLFFRASPMQRDHLIAENIDPDQLVELYAIPADVFYPDTKRYLSFGLNADCDDEEFIRSCVEPLVTSRTVKIEGKKFPGPVYIPQANGSYNIYFDNTTFDAARVTTVFSKVWRDGVVKQRRNGEDYVTSVAVNFRAIREDSHRQFINNVKRHLGIALPKPSPEVSEDGFRSTRSSSRSYSSRSSSSSSRVPSEKSSESSRMVETPKPEMSEPVKKVTGRFEVLKTNQ